MADLHRVDRSYGGGYTIRPTTWEEHAIDSAFLRGGEIAGAIAGNIIGASIAGLRRAARNARDRRMQRAVDAMESTARAEDFDHLLSLSLDFVDRYPQLPHGRTFLAIAFTAKGRYGEAIAAIDRTEGKHSSLKERGFVKPVRCGLLFSFLLFRRFSGALGRGGGVRDRPEADREAAEGP